MICRRPSTRSTTPSQASGSFWGMVIRKIRFFTIWKVWKETELSLVRMAQRKTTSAGGRRKARWLLRRFVLYENIQKDEQRVVWIRNATRRDRSTRPTRSAWWIVRSFYMITDIVRYAEYYVYIHPSRFELIEKTGKHSYRGRAVFDFSGKRLTTSYLDISRDEDNDRYYATLGPDKTIVVRDTFTSLSHLNKAFAVFQVFEVNATPTRTCGLLP